MAWASDKQRGTRQQRGYGKHWQVLRKKILLRDNYQCQVCLSNGKETYGNQVDHIINKDKGGTDDENNLQTICTACHKLKTQVESMGGVFENKMAGRVGVGVVAGCDENGNPISNIHHWNNS